MRVYRSQESNPGIIIQRNEFSHNKQGIILDQFCPYTASGYNLMTSNNDAPLFLNTYTIIRDNIIANSTGGSIYSGTKTHKPIDLSNLRKIRRLAHNRLGCLLYCRWRWIYY